MNSFKGEGEGPLLIFFLVCDSFVTVFLLKSSHKSNND